MAEIPPAAEYDIMVWLIARFNSLATSCCSIMPPYAHFEHLPYAHEPWKSLYVGQRVFTTLLLVPIWVVYYLIMPQSFRPRPSWSIKQIVAVNFTRRVHKVTEMAGILWGTRDPTTEPAAGSLKETRFEWVDPLPEKMRTGILDDPVVPFVRVGAFVWPKPTPRIGLRRQSSKKNMKGAADHVAQTQDILSNNASHGTSLVEIPESPSSEIPFTPEDTDVESTSARLPLIGMFMHGGGYCHMSAEEKSSTSRIPRRLMQVSLRSLIVRIDTYFELRTETSPKFTASMIHHACSTGTHASEAVEYRLLQYASFPAAVQDAAAVYAHIVKRYGKLIVWV